jgi:hypothetical protein
VNQSEKWSLFGKQATNRSIVDNGIVQRLIFHPIGVYYPVDIPNRKSNRKSQNIFQMKVSVTVLLLLFVALVFSNVADIDDDIPRRKVQYTVTGSGFQFQMQGENDKTESQMQLQVEANGDGIKYSYKFESNEGAPIEFQSRLTRILEFVPKGDAYDPTADSPVQVFVPSQWKPAQLTTRTVNGGTIYDFLIDTTNGQFGLFGHVVTQKFSNSSATYTPNAVKLDYLVRNWTYASTGSKLALESFVDTDVDCRNSDGQGRVDVDSRKDNKVKGNFGWKPFVNGDGTVYPVAATSFQKTGSNGTRGSYRIYHTFQTKNRIQLFNWDPSIGVSAGNSVYVSLLLLFAIFVMMM